MSREWVAIDFETANSSRGSACAVGMCLVRDGVVVDRWSTYIQPPGDGGFDSFNTALHGITAEAVRSAPTWPRALAQIVDFAAGRPLVTHNAAFDVGVIRGACTASSLPWPELSYVCTLVISRLTWQLLTYRLPFVAAAAGIAMSGHHEAQADADTAAQVMLAAMRFHHVDTVDDLLDTLRIPYGRLTRDSWTGFRQRGSSTTRREIPAANLDADPSTMLYGLNVCFTGTLTTMTRAEAQQRLAERGGQAVSGVSKRTDLLVVGMADPARFAVGMEVSGKHRKAQELLGRGHKIEMIGEIDFVEWLGS
ncbi:exonuclease domain-containing protein [Actinokineospora terrae]|uniref:DNA polymerase-3 subunit epsilon n=1 Tax=Actinokineospora terrae TaxID=155974 RepID=A0A1H9QZY3_9PSEU|nr:exonuclease domain-containing protein [Actinokineospora terrae]SER66018.1 DNA polymerase-3 subunit epsilon [Actinokineospora terrae]